MQIVKRGGCESVGADVEWVGVLLPACACLVCVYFVRVPLCVYACVIYVGVLGVLCALVCSFLCFFFTSFCFAC